MVKLNPNLVSLAVDIFDNGEKTHEFLYDSATGKFKVAPSGPDQAAYDAMDRMGIQPDDPEFLTVKSALTKAVMRKRPDWRITFRERDVEADGANSGVDTSLDQAA